MKNRYGWMGCRGVCLLACLLLAVAAEAASTQYVNEDELKMHSAPDSDQRVVERLESGERLEALTTPENGWVHVRTDDHEQGYVRISALSSSDPKDESDEAGHGHVGPELKKDEKLEELDHKELLKEYKKLENRFQDMQTASADAERVSSENAKYRKQLMDLQTEVASLKSENQSLQVRRTGMQTGGWIMAGGVLLGFVLASIWRLGGRRDPDTF